MKPTENTFFFLFNRVRTEAPHPIEKVELLESLEKPENQQRGLFDLFDLFDKGVSVGGKRNGSSLAFPHAGTERRDSFAAHELNSL
jgi:hypothetical protein